MSKKLVLLLLFTVLGYITTYFLNMDVILRKNDSTDKLDAEYEILLDQYHELLTTNARYNSRSYLSKLAEEELGLYLPEDFEDYAFYQVHNDEEGNKGITLLRFITPTAEALSTKPPTQLR
jgi:hypothetical protein